MRRWVIYLWGFVVALWDFLREPGVDLNTDFSPEFERERRNFCIYVVNRRGDTLFRAPIVESTLCKEEIELLFIGEGVPALDVVVTEIQA